MAIEQVLADPELRLAIAERARRHVEQHFDLWNNGAALATLLGRTRRRTAEASVPGRAHQPRTQEGA
jgi:hypothetical protein